MFWRGSTPWPRNVTWLPVWVPPTFTVLADTPGVWVMIPHTSRGFGTVDISSLVNVKLADAVDVSRIGETPDTVTVCSRPPTSIWTFTVKVDAVWTRIAS